MMQNLLSRLTVHSIFHQKKEKEIMSEQLIFILSVFGCCVWITDRLIEILTAYAKVLCWQWGNAVLMLRWR